MIRAHVLCCGGTGCTSSGSPKIQAAFNAEIEKNGLADEVKVVQTGCFGLCALGPVVIVYPDGTFYSNVTEEDVAAIRYNVENRPASGHGCFSETATSLGLFPELCDMSRVNDVSGKCVNRLSHLSDAGFYTPFGWMADYPNSLSSDAHDGNNERIGRAFVNLTVERLANAFKIIKEDTACEEYHKEWSAKQ